MMEALPARTRWAIVGAGFAGGATAWALGRAGLGPGIVFDQEPIFGFHASGRNAALLRLAEEDPLILALALRSHQHLRALAAESGALVGSAGGLTLAGPAGAARLAEHRDLFHSHGLETTLLTAGESRTRYPLLEAVDFDAALFCAAEGVIDIHGLLTLYLRDAREAGFTLHTKSRVDSLIVEAGRVTGIQTARGTVRADMVVDASGAWAGSLGRTDHPLPLTPLRRHLFVTGPPAGGHRQCPFAWHDDGGFYFRPEGDGLLLSPCDETPMPAGDPPIDPAAFELLAAKLAKWAPAFTDLPVRRSWACLRTFAPDRHPLIGPDPVLPGLFHVSGLGGFGAGTSAAIGELAATLLAGRNPDWIDTGAVTPARAF
jgi:glycine/D-amino acid oxidase-like deaminating enzyme